MIINHNLCQNVILYGWYRGLKIGNVKVHLWGFYVHVWRHHCWGLTLLQMSMFTSEVHSAFLNYFTCSMDFQRSYRCYHCHQKCNIGLEAVNHIIAEHPNKISLLTRLKDGKRQPMHYSYSSTELSSKTSKYSINFSKQRHRLPSESLKLTHHLQKTCLVLPWSQYPKICFIMTPCHGFAVPILSVPGLFYMDADFGLFAWLSLALWSWLIVIS